MRAAITLIVWCATGCYTGLGPGEGNDPRNPTRADGGAGDAADDGADDDAAPRDPGDDIPALATHSGLRRLTVAEYDRALRDLIGDTTNPASEFLPADALSPFDNDYAGQEPSEALILGAERLAIEAAARLLADPLRLEAIAGCGPQGLDGVDCLRLFITEFGRRAFRRPLLADEVDAFAELMAVGEEGNDDMLGLAAVVRAMLQDPNFLYRVEIGEPVPGAAHLVQLNDWEMATRLSFALWGTIPDDALLDAAADDALSSAQGVRDFAEVMITDARAREAVARFHALWLGYSRSSNTGIGADMLAESNALIERTVFDDEQPWLSLLTSTQSFLTPLLAEHYGLPAPAPTGAGWVDYGDSGRGGILSHGTVLSLGAKFGDTSPTVRGAELRTRMFCQSVELPEDLDVNVDDPPGVDPAACKWDRYAAHREAGQCAGCHALTDGLGFGLENYDAAGVFRTHDVGKPECEITGDGEVVGVGEFNGPAQLGAILADSVAVRNCATQQVFRFTSGRTEPDELDVEFLKALAADYEGRDVHLTELLVDVVSSEAFRFRALEQE